MSDLDPTEVLLKELFKNQELWNEFAFEIIGPPENRTQTETESAERLRSFMVAHGRSDWMCAYVPVMYELAEDPLVVDRIDWDALLVRFHEEIAVRIARMKREHAARVAADERAGEAASSKFVG